MIALLEAKRAGLLQPANWLPNLVAGLIVGIVALPLAMAFAIASGAKPEQGLYTAIVAGVVVSLFGGSRVQIAGPTGAFIVILASITAKYGIEGLQTATLMAGVILVLMGWARLGSVIRYIPDPVIIGFTTGIATLIWVTQWRDFFGLPAVGGEHFHEKLLNLLQAFPQLHPTTALLAAFALLLLIVTPRLPGLRRVPAPLVAMVAATLIVAIWRPEGVATIGSAFGGIPQTLPGLGLPDLSLPRMLELIGPAFTIAMLGAIESLLSAVVADGMAGTRHNSNQELVGQGLANVLTPLFGGFAATGAIARTATNIRNGGNSPIAGIAHSAVLLAVIVALAPLAVHIPLCALAAILFVVAWNMSELPRFVRMLKRAPHYDVGILLVTYVLTVFVDLVVAVNIGVILASLVFLQRMASAVEVRVHQHADLESELHAAGLEQLPNDVVVYGIDGPLFFGGASNLEHALVSSHTLPRVLIIRLSRVPFMDVTALNALEEVATTLQKRGVRVMLSEANLRVSGKLHNAGLTELLGADAVHASLAAALRCAIAA
ncbi:MAG TPA: SulP family inorganic anion transporter [Rhodocyclaceae bacterium]|nr:SulP family inorganic anion transporter [Rhodocyclaceae bacterium]